MNNQFLDLIDRRIEQKLNSKQSMKREPAKIISVSSGYKKAVVKLLNGATLELLNKTGEKLYESESVWIEFRTSPSSGYIAMRNGEADPLGGGGGFTVNNAAVLTEGQAASYLSEQEIINVDVNNMNKVVYGAPKNKIIVQGNLCVPNDRTLWTKDDITAEIDLKIPDVNSMENSTEDTPINLYHYFTRMSFSYQSNTATYPYNRSWNFASYYTKDGGTPTSAASGTQNLVKSDIPFYVGYVFAYGSIHAISYPAAPYGYINGAVLQKLIYNSSGELIVSNGVSLYRNFIPFASQAELDYAVNVTQRADIAPSVTEGE